MNCRTVGASGLISFVEGQDLLDGMKAKNPNAPALVIRTTAAGCGLIGVRAGKNVKYPSAIYWSGLRTYGVLRSDKAPDSLSALVTRGRTIESYELAVRAVSHWDPEIPPAPSGFADELPNGFGSHRGRVHMTQGANPGCSAGHLAGRAAHCRPSPRPGQRRTLVGLGRPEPNAGGRGGPGPR